MFQIKVAEKIKTHILCSMTFFPKNRVVYEIIWKKCSRSGQATGDSIVRRMRSACGLPKATNTHLEYAILIAFLLQQWLYESASMLLCTYISCHVLYLFPLVRVLIAWNTE